MKKLKKHFNINSSRYYLYLEIKHFAENINSGSLVLDAGAGDDPYKELFKDINYHSTDFGKVNKIYAPCTYICDLVSIPIRSNSYDAIIFTQVLEHVPEPELVLQELFRILKPGGIMFFTSPLFFSEHEIPYDFYRYTKFGLNYLFDKVGFSIERINWLEGYFGTLGYQYEHESRDLPYLPMQFSNKLVFYLIAPFLLIHKILAFILSILFYKLDRYYKYTNSGYPKNYLAIVKK